MIGFERGGQSRADEKSRIRATILRHRKTLSPYSRFRDDQAFSLASAHESVALYVSVEDEPDTRALISRLDAAGVRVLLPVLRPGSPQWGWFSDWADLSFGWRGIPVPSEANGRVAEVSLVLAAALAATTTGARLGTGGGWYDRALADYDGGVGVLLNDCEVLPCLPVDLWDHSVDVIVTDSCCFQISA